MPLESKNILEKELVSLFQKAREEIIKETGIDSVPNTVLFSERPDAQAKPIRPEKFAEMRKFKKYIEDILVDPNELKMICEATKGAKKARYSMTSKELLKRHYALVKKMKLVDTQSETGVSAFATADIKEDDILIYAGVLKKQIHDSRKRYSVEVMKLGEGYIILDGDEYRGIGDYFDSLVCETTLHQDYVLSDKNLAKKIATANFAGTEIYITDLNMTLPCLIATRPIKANERLGYDYQSEYWLKFRMEPLLLSKDYSIIPKKEYRSLKFVLALTPSNMPSCPNFKNDLIKNFTWKEFREHFMLKSNSQLLADPTQVIVLTPSAIKTIMEREGSQFVGITAPVATLEDYKKLAERFTLLFGEKFKAELAKIANPWVIDTQSQTTLVLKPKLPEKNKIRFEEILEDLGINTDDMFKPVLNKDNKTVYQFAIPNLQCFKLATHWDLMVQPKCILPSFSYKTALGVLGLLSIGAGIVISKFQPKP